MLFINSRNSRDLPVFAQISLFFRLTGLRGGGGWMARAAHCIYSHLVHCEIGYKAWVEIIGEWGSNV